MKIKKFFEMFKSYDYEKIINILNKSHGWGLGISNNIDDFENNEEYFKDPVDDNDYSEQFHIYLTDLQSGRLKGEMNRNFSLKTGKWRLGIPVFSPTSIYNKLT
jgi:hypothetical protein